MSNLQSILYEIKPCDPGRPYVFISYSSLDSELVWKDVREFQRRGFNVWLDEKNLDKTKTSWREDAIAAIEDMECELVVFYVSANSLRSDACYQELSKTVEERTKAMHFGPVKFIAVDAEPVGDITAFAQQVFRNIRASGLDKDERSRQALALDGFMRDFFNSNNEKVRIHPKNEENRKIDYYDDITASFPESARIYEPQPEEAEEIPEAVSEEKIIPKPEPEKEIIPEPEPETEEVQDEQNMEETPDAADPEKTKAAMIAVRRKLASAHPDWNSKRLYAVTRAIVLGDKTEEKKVPEEKKDILQEKEEGKDILPEKNEEAVDVNSEDILAPEEKEEQTEPAETEIKEDLVQEEMINEPESTEESVEEGFEPEPEIISKPEPGLEEIKETSELTSAEVPEPAPAASDEQADWFSKAEGDDPRRWGRKEFGKNEVRTTAIKRGKLEIPEGYTGFQTKMVHSLYWGNSDLVEVILPDSMQTLNIGEFRNCTNLKTIRLPKYLTKIPYDVFRDCSSLKEITIPGNVTAMDSWAFQKCTSLRKVVLPEGLETMASSVFEGCASLKDIHLPPHLNKMDMSCFQGCGSLKEIRIPGSLKRIPLSAFEGCVSLRTVIIEEGVEKMESAFGKCGTGRMHVWIPDSVTTISSMAFDKSAPTIHCHKGSCAEEFAKRRSYPCVVY